MKAPSVRIPLLFRGKAEEPPGIIAVARVDRRTKNITKRLNPGEIAIIDHSDLDRVSAEELIRRKVAAVVNVSVSITGRYPNLGPKLLLDAGIPVIDGVGQDVLVRVTDGAVVRLDSETLYLGDQVVAKGTPLTEELVEAAMTEARAMVGVQIESFAENTLEFLRREHELLTRGHPGARHGHRHERPARPGRGPRLSLPGGPGRPAALHPRVQAGDGGSGRRRGRADRGRRTSPTPSSVTWTRYQTRRCAAAPNSCVHAYPDGRAPGLARVRELGLDAVTMPAPGTSEDVALLVADAKGASLIAVVGHAPHAGGVPRQGRPGMSSTFITHLRVAGKLVNARGVHQLYHSRISSWSLLVLCSPRR